MLSIDIGYVDNTPIDEIETVFTSNDEFNVVFGNVATGKTYQLMK